MIVDSIAHIRMQCLAEDVKYIKHVFELGIGSKRLDRNSYFIQQFYPSSKHIKNRTPSIKHCDVKHIVSQPVKRDY